jgi:thioredoxin-dependent peroxiredoxin
MIPDVGAAAPAFDLESDNGSRVALGDFDGQWLILYFYPRDNTPGCTVEAQDFTRIAPRLKKLGAVVVGVSKDSVKSHGSFRDKVKIGFRLLSDPDRVAHEAYGAWGTKTMYGKEIEGTLRSTFLVSPTGDVARVWKSVRVNGHADAVADAIAELTGVPPAKKPAKGPVAKAPAAKARAAKAPPAKALKAPKGAKPTSPKKPAKATPEKPKARRK